MIKKYLNKLGYIKPNGKIDSSLITHDIVNLTLMLLIVIIIIMMQKIAGDLK